MNTKLNKGFTLIELLVVISIIGLLSSVVLAALQGARVKGIQASGLQFDDHTYHAFGADALGIWNFDDGALSTVKDSSNYNHPGTISGTPTWVNGINKGALSFDGVNNVVTIANADNRTSGDITVSAWVYSTDFTANMNIMVKTVAGNSWYFLFESGNLRWISTSGSALSCSVPTNNTWHNVAATQTGAKASVYIDGTVCNSTTVMPLVTYNSSPLYIGGSALFSYRFKGYIDQVRLYSSSLLASEIKQIYAEGLEAHSDFAHR